MRRRWEVIGVLLLICGVLQACAEQLVQLKPAPHRVEQLTAGDPVIGKRLFQEKKCAQCHAIKGVGGRVGPDLGQLLETHNIYLMAARLWNHAVGMTQVMEAMGIERPRFQGDEMAHLLAYFVSLEVVGDATVGRTVFQKKGCIRCHAIEGKGGTVGPDLAWTPHPHPPFELAGMMWNHSPTMSALMDALRIQRPSFEWVEMADLLAYLVEVQQRAARSTPVWLKE